MSVFDSISSLSRQNVCACVVSIPHDNKSNAKIRCRTTAHQTTCQFTVMFTIAFTFKSIISQKIHCVMHSKCLDYVRKVICYKSMHLLMLWHSILMNTRLLTDYKTKIFLAWRHLEILVLPAKRRARGADQFVTSPHAPTTIRSVLFRNPRAPRTPTTRTAIIENAHCWLCYR